MTYFTSAEDEMSIIIIFFLMQCICPLQHGSVYPCQDRRSRRSGKLYMSNNRSDIKEKSIHAGHRFIDQVLCSSIRYLLLIWDVFC